MSKWLMILAAVLLAAFCGCTSANSEFKQLPEPTRVLGASESNRTMQVRVGEYVKISLKVNPSTGYTWFFRIDKEKNQAKSPIELAGERLVVQDEGNSNKAGVPGVKELMVHAAAPGFASVIGECKRPGSQDRPALTVKYGFVVIR